VNPLSTYYSEHPNYSSQLGRLTSIVRKKYDSLRAIDIGANIGDTACIIKTAEDIPVMCIEGDGYTFGFLQENIKQLSNSTAHNMFLGEKTESIAATLGKSGWNTTIQPDLTNAAPRIHVNSLDDFILVQPDHDKFKLLKIDTEGFDCSILRGAKEFIRRVGPVIAFEYNRENMNAIGEPGLNTLFSLIDLGYSTIVFHDAAGRFLLSTNLNNEQLIRDLHDYADGKHGEIYYYDITVFHKTDSDIASSFEDGERIWRDRDDKI
jgi:FkbM family methyltransferase